MTEKVVEGSVLTVRCPRCGKVDKFNVTREHIEELNISGISNVAIDHDDHVILVAFDIWGSIRGTYVYKKAKMGEVPPSSFDIEYERRIMGFDSEALGDGFILYIYDWDEKSLEIYGYSDPKIDNEVMKNLLLISKIQQILKLRYEMIKVASRDWKAYIVQGEHRSVILVVRAKLDTSVEKSLFEWLIKAKETF